MGENFCPKCLELICVCHAREAAVSESPIMKIEKQLQFQTECNRLGRIELEKVRAENKLLRELADAFGREIGADLEELGWERECRTAYNKWRELEAKDGE